RRRGDEPRVVAFRLLLKAAARLRHDGYAAGTLTLGINFRDAEKRSAGSWGATSWSASEGLGAGCTDSQTMLDALGRLWGRVPAGEPAGGVVTRDGHDQPAVRGQHAVHGEYSWGSGIRVGRHCVHVRAGFVGD